MKELDEEVSGTFPQYHIFIYFKILLVEISSFHTELHRPAGNAPVCVAHFISLFKDGKTILQMW